MNDNAKIIILIAILITGSAIAIVFFKQNKQAKSEEFLFFDDFSGDLSNWKGEGSGSSSIIDGKLQLEYSGHDGGGYTFWTVEEFSGDLRIEYIFTAMGSDYGAITFFYGKGINQDIFNWKRMGIYGEYASQGKMYLYTFSYYKTGLEGSQKISRIRKIWGCSDPTEEDCSLILSEHSDPCPEKDKEYKTVIEKKGNKIKVFINEQLVLDAIDDGKYIEPLDSGRIALRLFGLRKALYDDFKVVQLN